MPKYAIDIFPLQVMVMSGFLVGLTHSTHGWQWLEVTVSDMMALDVFEKMKLSYTYILVLGFQLILLDV